MLYTPHGIRQQNPGTIMSIDLLHSGFLFSTAGSNAYPAANLAIYMPITIVYPVTVYEVFVLTGTLTTSNGIEIGAYDTAGTRLFTTAMTITTASEAVNSSGMTNYTLEPGTYYMAFGCDGTRNFHAGTMAAGLYQSMGALEETGLTGAALPATATFATMTRAYMPVFGFNVRSTAL